MQCVICLEAIPRIVPGGTVSAGYPGLIQLDVPFVPRVGEEIFRFTGGVPNRHQVTSVRYLIDREHGMTGAQVLVTEGKPVEP